MSSPHGSQFKSAPVIQGGHDKCALVMSLAYVVRRRKELGG